jgi:hypothetical protein
MLTQSPWNHLLQPSQPTMNLSLSHWAHSEQRHEVAAYFGRFFDLGLGVHASEEMPRSMVDVRPGSLRRNL